MRFSQDLSSQFVRTCCSHLQDVQVLCDFDLGVFQLLPQLVVVGVRHRHELHPALL